MNAPRSTNRKMFWRILRRLLTANPGRLFVMLLALGTGAAVTAALLNLQVDAKRRLTSDFSAFGTNVVITAKGDAAAPNFPATPRLDAEIPAFNEGAEVTHVAVLYLSVDASRYGQSTSDKPVPVIVAGFDGKNMQRVLPARTLEGSANATSSAVGPPTGAAGGSADLRTCRVGERVAAVLQIHAGDRLVLTNRANRIPFFVTAIQEFGGPEDNQILTDIFNVQQLTWVRGEKTTNNVSLILLNVPGTSQQIGSYVASLQEQFPGLDVRPVRQFTEAQAKIYDRISGLLSFTVGIVLVLTALCVMAAMTNVAAERKNDVGLMKAVGGATRRVLRLFLAEATLLGFAGGMIGAAVGIALSMYLGKQVFGVAAQPRLIVYPISVVLTTIVAILSAFPLRRLAGVRPAAVFRGGE